MSEPALTLMAVHAHPDDEATGTGGVLHKYGKQGIHTVLVTCTGGELGDGSDGAKPGQPGHDEEQVRRVRAEELLEACRVLGISVHESLGYRDSGMADWPQHEEKGRFSTAPLAEASERLGELMRRYQPQVVITYDESGGYGHPDHIRAHEVTVAAARATGIPSKLYFTALARSAIARGVSAARDMGVDLREFFDEEFDPDEIPFGVDDSVITTTVNVRPDVGAKLAALKAHASQSDNGFLLRLPQPVVAEVFGYESFIRAEDRTGAPLPESDLFAGLRRPQ